MASVQINVAQGHVLGFQLDANGAQVTTDDPQIVGLVQAQARAMSLVQGYIQRFSQSAAQAAQSGDYANAAWNQAAEAAMKSLLSDLQAPPQ